MAAATPDAHVFPMPPRPAPAGRIVMKSFIREVEAKMNWMSGEESEAAVKELEVV